MARTALLDRLYSLFDDLERRIGGARRLGDCDGYMDWPDRGVYFLFSADETRVTGEFPRLTRVGTHAVSRGSGSTLWERLRTHRGAQRGTYVGGVDILPALKGEDSPKGIFRLRVSSGLKYAFAWAVEGRRPVVTKDVLSSACSPVNWAFLPAICGRQRRGT
ncbi:hypothetical protein [Haloplanus salinarum]|uniref:hypothetical protein n=1 Tax=Haloplanus salinarum TaxID=1912324 RepID=UPI00214C554B|nr:hypothetical protein [Haloplanus salinarum]